MTGQPLSRVRPKANYTFPRDPFQQRRDLAPYIAEVIMLDAATEHRLALILVDALRADPKTAIAMYQAVQSLEARRKMLVAAMGAKLNRDDQLLVDAVMNAIAPSHSVRHAFAHHIWGLSHEIPDALLLINPADLLRYDADAADINIKMRKSPQAIPPTPLDKSKITVWRKPDFERAVTNAREALDTVAELEWSFHYWKQDEINAQTRQLLLNRPSLAAWYQAEIHRRNRSQEPQKRPRKRRRLKP